MDIGINTGHDSTRDVIMVNQSRMSQVELK